MVSDVSAIEVASTILRRPCGAGAIARSCTSASSAPNNGTMSMAGSDTARAAGFRNGGFRQPRQKHQDRSRVSSQGARDGVGDLRFDRLAGITRNVAGIDRECAPFARDRGRIIQQARHPRAVEGRRHHQQFEIVAQALLRIAGQRKAEIGIERALVKFVEQNRGDALERRIVEDQVSEDPLGDDLDAGRARDLGAEANPVAHGLADRLAKRCSHAVGGGARRQAARFQHQYFAILRPRLAREHQRDAGGLAGAGRRDQHGGVALSQHRCELRQRIVDRQR